MAAVYVSACPDGSVSVDAEGAATCTAPLVLVPIEQSAGFLPELSAEDATQIAGAVAALWAVAWVWKTLRR